MPSFFCAKFCSRSLAFSFTILCWHKHYPAFRIVSCTVEYNFFRYNYTIFVLSFVNVYFSWFCMIIEWNRCHLLNKTSPSTSYNSSNYPQNNLRELSKLRDWNWYIFIWNWWIASIYFSSIFNILLKNIFFKI